jgi:flagellar basal body-associated protein FliL
MHDIGVIPIDYQLPTQDCETLKSVRLPIFKDSLVNVFSSPNLEELAFPNLYLYSCNFCCS